MKVLHKQLCDIALHKFQRVDCKYWDTTDNFRFDKFVYLKEIFDIINGSVQTANYTTEKTSTPYIRIGDISYKFGISGEDVIYLNEDSEINDEKKLLETDLVLATIGATVGKIGLSDKVVGGTFSNNTVVLRIKNQNIPAKFYELLLQTDFYISYIFGVVSQKAQPNLQDYDLRNIKLPIIVTNNAVKALEKCNPLLDKIEKLNCRILKNQQVIDNVLEREFNFDYENFEELKNRKTFQSTYSDFANNPDLRFSAKFHREAGDFVMKQLTELSIKRIKHFLSEPIVLGASISPNDYYDDGDYYYISMATIKNWEFNPEDARPVFSAYAEDKKEKTVRKDDIILARSGEGTIGKVAIIEDDDIEGVFADFTMRIRLKNYNSKFAYYYFRTTYFQYLIEIYKKGLGNNTNIFPIVIKEFPLPDISLEDQQRIVDEIKAEIDKQNAVKAEIAKLREDIDRIIEEAIK